MNRPSPGTGPAGRERPYRKANSCPRNGLGSTCSKRSHRDGDRLAAVLTLASGALTGVAPAANASGGGSGDDGGYDVTIPLTERTTDELTDGPNSVKARGAADKMRHDGRIYLSLPVRGTDDHRAAEAATAATSRGSPASSRTPAPDRTSRWSRLRVNYETGKITAVVNGGPRVAVLRVAGKDHDGHRARGGGDAALKLTLRRREVAQPCREGRAVRRR